MLEWNDYLKSVLNSKTVMDNIVVSSGETTIYISPIIKASILMLEDMISAQGNHNIFVFPEIERSAWEFLVSKVIFNITSGKIKMSYDPQKFREGQILKYKGCSVEFVKISEDKDHTRIYIRFSDGMEYGVPVELAPFFQISDSKTLSSYKRFCKVYSATDAMEALNNPENGNNYLDALENHRTHLNGSVVFVSEIKTTKQFLTTATVDGRNLSEILYMAQITGDGDIVNLTAGQLSGHPAIIIASDLYAVQNAIRKGVTIQSIIFDASQPNAVEKQLDAFDDMSKYAFPVVCITDTAESFELDPLLERKYNLWRWDCDSITYDLLPEKTDSTGRRVRNCAKHNVNYQAVPDEHISNAVRLLYRNKSVIEDQPAAAIATYEKLFSLAFTMLRCVIPLGANDKEKYRELIAGCQKTIEDTKRFLPTELYDDLSKAVTELLSLFSKSFKNNKYDAICDLVLSEKYSSICIVIPVKMDRRQHENYWETLDFPCSITVMYPPELEERSDNDFDLVIVSGWFGNKVMRRIIYGFASKEYVVLAYPCEQRWEKPQTKQWKKALDNSGNGEVIKRSFSKQGRLVSASRFEHPELPVQPEEQQDEFDDIESILRTNKYRQYGRTSKTELVVDAVPVSFVGGCLAFYRTTHKVLVATDIIVNNGDNITSKTPDALEVGDFVIVRETGRDIIREIADRILEKKGIPESRKLSAKWKEALSVESLFSTPDEIHRKLRDFGCKKDYTTVRNWITNDEIIQPGDKEDLYYIAEATGDEVLKEKLDEIYEAGRDVRSAHVQAGTILSKRLKSKISEHILALGEIDSFNIWDPISIQLDDVGLVKILKIIDISEAIPVDIGNTNRLLSE